MILISFGSTAYQILQSIIAKSIMSTIEFRQEDKPGAYKHTYEIAFIGNERVENEKGIYLSRIPKKNGKSRYYLTREECKSYCRGCDMEGCSSHSCRGGYYYEYTYTSKYIGNDLEIALDSLAKCGTIVDKTPVSIHRQPQSSQFNEQEGEYTEW